MGAVRSVNFLVTYQIVIFLRCIDNNGHPVGQTDYCFHLILDIAHGFTYLVRTVHINDPYCSVMEFRLARESIGRQINGEIIVMFCQRPDLHNLIAHGHDCIVFRIGIRAAGTHPARNMPASTRITSRSVLFINSRCSLKLGSSAFVHTLPAPVSAGFCDIFLNYTRKPAPPATHLPANCASHANFPPLFVGNPLPALCYTDSISSLQRRFFP